MMTLWPPAAVCTALNNSPNWNRQQFVPNRMKPSVTKGHPYMPPTHIITSQHTPTSTHIPISTHTSTHTHPHMHIHTPWQHDGSSANICRSILHSFGWYLFLELFWSETNKFIECHTSAKSFKGALAHQRQDSVASVQVPSWTEMCLVLLWRKRMLPQALKSGRGKFHNLGLNAQNEWCLQVAVCVWGNICRPLQCTVGTHVICVIVSWFDTFFVQQPMNGEESRLQHMHWNTHITSMT